MYLLMLLLLSLYITMEQFSRSAGYTQKPIIILLLVDGALSGLLRETPSFLHYAQKALSRRGAVALSRCVPRACQFHHRRFSQHFAPFAYHFNQQAAAERLFTYCSMAFNYYWHKMDECNCVIKQNNGAATAASVCAFERRAYCAGRSFYSRDRCRRTITAACSRARLPVGAAGQNNVGATFR
jgi:hypothetical protein